MKEIPHHLIDVADPKDEFSVAQFKKLAEEKIKGILNRGKLPIIVGGSGFYIQAIVDGLVLPEVPPNQKLRDELESKSLEELGEILDEEIVDMENKRRLIRAIEIKKTLGEIPKLEKKPKYNISLRDDKSYPYVIVTKNRFPCIYVSRPKSNIRGKVFGPYPKVGLLKSCLQLIRKTFPYRSCKSLPKKACLFYHLNLCPGICVGRISSADYKQNVGNIVKILKGERRSLIRSFEKKI